jgi:hypothetical protein
MLPIPPKLKTACVVQESLLEAEMEAEDELHKLENMADADFLSFCQVFAGEEGQ